MTEPRIDWTEQAARQVDQAYDYIALSNSEDVAAKVTMQIISSVQQLIAFPMSGRLGRVPGTRELVISNTPFIAAYTIQRDRLVILAVYHGAQRWPEAF
jgi:toxin ParE1/3/4